MTLKLWQLLYSECSLQGIPECLIFSFHRLSDKSNDEWQLNKLYHIQDEDA